MIVNRKEAISHIRNGWGLNGLDKKFFKDIEFILDVIKYDYSIIKEIDFRLLSNREFALKLLEVNGTFFNFLSDELKSDKNICIKAIQKTNGKVMEYIPNYLRKDSDILHTYNEFRLI